MELALVLILSTIWISDCISLAHICSRSQDDSLSVFFRDRSLASYFSRKLFQFWSYANFESQAVGMNMKEGCTFRVIFQITYDRITVLILHICMLTAKLQIWDFQLTVAVWRSMNKRKLKVSTQNIVYLLIYLWNKFKLWVKL